MEKLNEEDYIQFRVAEISQNPIQTCYIKSGSINIRRDSIVMFKRFNAPFYDDKESEKKDKRMITCILELHLSNGEKIKVFEDESKVIV